MFTLHRISRWALEGDNFWTILNGACFVISIIFIGSMLAG